MRKMITKDIKTTKVKGVIVKVENGLPTMTEIEPVSYLGSEGERKTKQALKEKGLKDVTVTEVETTSKKYAMDVETFLQYAHEVTETEELESEDNE